MLQFPEGELPAEGFRCPECGEEMFHAEQVAAAQRMAERLGLYGPQVRSSRAAIKLGNSTAMTFDQEMARRAGIAPGTELEVGLMGDRIVVKARKPAKKPRARATRRRS
jgi:DNA-directed RNA polymerase subunit RPC12/RpoP